MSTAVVITVIKADDERFVVQAGDITLTPAGLDGLTEAVTAILKKVFGTPAIPADHPSKQRMDN